MIYVVKSSYGTSGRDVIKLFYSDKIWDDFKKILDYYNPNCSLIKIIDGGRDLRKRLMSKLFQYIVVDEWCQYDPGALKAIDDYINNRKDVISKDDLLDLLGTKGKLNKKLEAVCNYLSGLNPENLDSYHGYQPFKDIVDKLGLDKISSLRFRYKDCQKELNKLSNKLP